MGYKELLVVVLSVLMIQPSGLVAASKDASSRSAVGTIEARGSVMVGAVAMPSDGALFAGDSVRTNNGSATVQYKGGARVFLGSDSVADFSAGQVRLNQGVMSFQTVTSGMAFAASTLKLQPSTPKAAANMTLQDNKASIAVTEGTVKVIDPSGVQLASLRAGEARLFEEAPVASAPAPAAPPQGGGNSASNSDGSKKWLIALGVGVVGASLGIAGLVKANDANDRTDSQAALLQQLSSQNSTLTTQFNSLTAQNAALSTQLRALQAQTAALQAYANSVAASSGQQASLVQQLSAAVAEMSSIQSQLGSIQQQTSSLLAAIATQGGTATAAQLSQLQSLSTQQNSLNSRLQQATNNINTISNNLRNSTTPTLSPTRAS